MKNDYDEFFSYEWSAGNIKESSEICIRLLGKNNWVYIKRQQNDTKA